MSTARLLRFLLIVYYPFLLLLLVLLAGLTLLLVQFTLSRTGAWILTAPILLWLGVTMLQLLEIIPIWFMKPPNVPGTEIRLPSAFLEPIMFFTIQIVRERELRMPHDIRLSPDAIAHVYEDREGQRVLVLGGLLVASMTQRALAGIVAHELAHFAAGDTDSSLRAGQRGQTMSYLEFRCHGRVSMYFNPVIWLIRLYHLAFQLAFLEDSKRREFAADQQSARQAGKEEAVAALLLIETLACLPSLRLVNIAKEFAARREPLDGIFTEQMRRANALHSTDWEDACRKALKKRTTRWDSHPALRDRIQALGVSPKRALPLLMARQDGPPARDLFPAWKELERLMSGQWLDAVRIEMEVKQDVAQIILGRPR